MRIILKHVPSFSATYERARNTIEPCLNSTITPAQDPVASCLFLTPSLCLLTLGNRSFSASLIATGENEILRCVESPHSCGFEAPSCGLASSLTCFYLTARSFPVPGSPCFTLEEPPRRRTGLELPRRASAHPGELITPHGHLLPSEGSWG